MKARRTKSPQASIDYLVSPGEALRKLRKACGKTQEEVAYDTQVNPDGVCSIDTYKGLESGKNKPSHDVLVALMPALNTDYQQYESIIFGVDLQHFYADFRRICDIAFGGDYKETKAQLDKLKQQPYCNINMRVVKQRILYLEALLECYSNNNLIPGKTKLYNALELTLNKKLLDRDKDNKHRLHYKKLIEYDLSEMEIDILKEIATLEQESGDRNFGVNIDRALFKLLKESPSKYEINKTTLPVIAFNLTTSLLHDDNDLEAKDILEYAIGFAKNTRATKFLGHLLGNRAWVAFKLNEDGYENLFKEAFARLSVDTYESAQRFKKFAADSCGVLL